MWDKIRRQFRRITQPLFWRIYKWYLSKERWYSYKGLTLKVAPSVFHPGLLFSTKILVKFILKLDLKTKSVLELGAGSGLIALSAAKAGAKVLATDINPVAVASMQESKAKNKLSLSILHSDLFKNIAAQKFDFIFLNPPFFAQEAKTDREKAFFCGANFEYFHQLLAQMGAYCCPSTVIYMILTDDCAIDTIRQIALSNGFVWELVYQELVWGETNFIFKLTITPNQ